jgi:DNA-directed RNA polymerase subunit F
MATTVARAKQMLEETNRREEEAIKRQAQAAKHFEVDAS